MPITLKLKHELWLLIILAGMQLTHHNAVGAVLHPALYNFLHPVWFVGVGVYLGRRRIRAVGLGIYGPVWQKAFAAFLYGMLALFTLAFGLASTYGSFMLAHICAGTFGGVMLALVQTIVGDVMLFECSWPSDGHCDDIFLGIHRCGGDDGSFTAVRWGWHLPFIGIGCFSLIFIVFAIVSLPVLNAHLLRGNSQSPWQRIRETLADNNQKTKPLAR
jgi:hypothetical protein